MKGRCITTMYILFLLILPLTAGAQTQDRFLHNQQILDLTQEAVDKIYNYEFDKAEKIMQEIELKTPGHPLNPLLRALFLYQRDFPMRTTSSSAKEFEALCTRSYTLAEAMLKDNEEDTEGTAFDMVARSLLSMYYVDNGESMAVARGASALYRQVAKGFKKLNELNEFYFTTGLYNYYRIAYPEAHPIYKPIAALFPDGNKALGLQQLKFASDHCIFLKAEAILFLSLIYNNYENSPLMAVITMQKLHSMYPQNAYFRAELTKTQLINQQYESARDNAQVLINDPLHPFAYARGLIYMGVVIDRQDHQSANAIKLLEKGLELSASFGKYGEPLLTMGNFELSRIYRNLGDQKKADHYYKKGASTAIYKYEYTFSK